MAKVALITGANSGIGKATAFALAEQGYHLVVACRSEAGGQQVAQELRSAHGATVEYLPLDLSSLASVRACADAFLQRDLPLHVLVNNAGIVARGLTEDGFELVFGVNHLGHFLLTRLLLERLKDSAPSRIVNVSSKSHYSAKRFDFDLLREPTKTVSALREYGVSKAANVLFTRELAKRLEGTGVTTYAVHPGQVKTNAWRRIPWPFKQLLTSIMLTPEQGAKGVVRAASAEEAASETGLYYDQSKPCEPSPLAQDDGLAIKLWEQSLAWTQSTAQAS